MYNSLAAVCEDMQSNGISVVECELKSNPSLCMEKGRIVGYDRRKFENEAECCTALIHEDGHFESGAFYKPFSVYQVKQTHPMVRAEGRDPERLFRVGDRRAFQRNGTVYLGCIPVLQGRMRRMHAGGHLSAPPPLKPGCREAGRPRLKTQQTRPSRPKRRKLPGHSLRRSLRQKQKCRGLPCMPAVQKAIERKKERSL